MSRKSALRWGLGAFLLLVLLVCGSCLLLEAMDKRDRKRLAETLAAGDPIIAALERFRADNNEYPETLDALVPRYLKEIPKPTWGTREWQYWCGQETYALFIQRSRSWYAGYRYTPGGGHWQGDG